MTTTIDELVSSTRILATVPDEAAAVYESRREQLANRVNEELRSRADLMQLLGGNPPELMETNHANHSAFMANVFALGQYELLARSLVWVYRSYAARGFSHDYFPVAIAAWEQAVRQLLPPEQSEPILAVYGWIRTHHQELVRLASLPQEISEKVPDRWGQMQERYLQALLGGDAAQALDLARQVRVPEDLEAFYLRVVQPALERIGTLWETGEISVAVEHLASAITSRVVVGLTGLRRDAQHRRGLAVVTAAPNEFHELGAWMVADLLELDGWMVRYLGANTPIPDLLELVRRERPSLLALSVTMPFNLARTREIIAALRADQIPLRILAGGRVFNQQPGLWQQLGADGCAADAREAVLWARKFSEFEEMWR